MEEKKVSEYDIYLDDFNKSIEEIRKEYDKCPNRVNRKMRIVAKEIKADNINSRLSLTDAIEKALLKLKLTDVIFYGLFVLIVLLAPISELLPLYIFGIVFFIAGFGVGMYQKGFGLIFLFSHGGTGFGIMLGTLLASIPESATLLLESSKTSKIIIGMLVILMLLAILSMILHNLSDDVKKIDYYRIIPVCLLTLILIICKFIIPITMILNNILRLG